MQTHLFTRVVVRRAIVSIQREHEIREAVRTQRLRRRLSEEEVDACWAVHPVDVRGQVDRGLDEHSGRHERTNTVIEVVDRTNRHSRRLISSELGGQVEEVDRKTGRRDGCWERRPSRAARAAGA